MHSHARTIHYCIISVYNNFPEPGFVGNPAGEHNRVQSIIAGVCAYMRNYVSFSALFASQIFFDPLRRPVLPTVQHARPPRQQGEHDVPRGPRERPGGGRGSVDRGLARPRSVGMLAGDAETSCGSGRSVRGGEAKCHGTGRDLVWSEAGNEDV